ncbi:MULTISPECIES: hypothetical protein [unclassified Mesorhizobium]|uniref:hypothetical protein n=1 Tax=unclassified Mesorhizobium TaxID=325217 RepID=UPI000960FB90|nr:MULTISPECIES: hypothetical protein [unclassified Mesorhizobium]MBN9255282.1 hypothetical protein [Mesorhizobium sp.]OJX74209.1 MAG: hypothetical protein BGO93_16780 [Mesorhizobium sp. 65-26]
MIARIWFPDRQILEDHDVNGDAATSIDHVERLIVDGVTYVINKSDDPGADYIARQLGTA